MESPFIAADGRFRSNLLMDFATSRQRIDDAERFSYVYMTRVFSGFIFRAGSRQFHFRRDDKCRMGTGNLGV